ncbi:MAG: cell wall-binding repeat-containing protein, partial [Actinomycetia bacterium]|nr:cell wall-binding repeat-containing protein [Actinomycetes bacterium]
GTAASVASETITVLGDAYTGGAFMATGANFPDALAASPIMFKKGMPLVLVDPNGNFSLPTGVTKVTILGSTSAVPASVQTALATKYDTRVAGTDRYATGAAVAQYGVSKGLTWNGVGIATAQDFPDALSAGPLLGSQNSVMLFTQTASLSSAAADKLSANKGTIAKATFVGGTSAVATNTRNQVKAILTGIPTPADTNPFVVPSLEWDPIAPDTWEMGANGIEWEAYRCGNCHHLGWVTKGSKPTVGKFVSTSTTGTMNAWVTDPAGPTTSPEKYIAGSSIQCEVCHGSGEAGVGVGNHFGNYTSQVKILRGTQLLDSGVCGKCHASWAAGNTLGFTPDQNILTFATPYAKTDVPTEATWNGGTNAETGKAWRFFPNGANRSNKHVYFTEWALSGHAFRGAYNVDRENPRVTPYMANHTGHYDSTGAYGGTAYCAKCHTGEGYAVRKGLKIMANYDLSAPGATGQMGQECVTCHIPHGAATDNGMAVRKPDAAVTQSGITMTSICEDCHNWQREQEGKTGFEANPQPVQSLTARGGYSHPTREIYNGVGMYEVANAGKFMPNVKCEECHMPATKSDFPDKTGLERYANQSWKRYTHSMHIMEPGNAAEWGLAAWGDSCSPCHAGESQANLQAAIVTWQDGAASASVEASAAYAAAYAAAPGSEEDTNTPAFKALMGRAYYNYRNYLGEGSMGAHNPEYIVEGLKVATKMAKSVNGQFTMFAGGTAMSGAAYVVGTLHNGDDSGAADAKLVITFDDASTATVYSDANGNFSYVFDSALTATSITWERCSDAAADLVYTPPV